MEVLGIAQPNDTVPRDYVRSVRLAGGLPVLLPLTGPDDVEELVDAVDGVVVAGGGDVDPARYGAEPEPDVWGVDSDRDAFDLRLWEVVVERGVPALGVCRGLQTLAVHLGGRLHQHVPAHQHTGVPYGTAHPVSVAPGSRLAEVVGDGALGVNSLHHQVVSEAGSGRVVARADDGAIEAIEVDGAPEVLAVQWHPELLPDRSPHRALFTDLVRRADRRGRGLRP